MNKINEPVYLGDSVYVEFDGFQVRLYLNNGMGDHNSIYMEPDVLIAFQNYLLKLSEHIKDQNQES